jgi:hypothetical protein
MFRKIGGMVMDQFEKVTIVKKANIYFDGKVTSRTVLFENGEKKTLGIMAAWRIRIWHIRQRNDGNHTRKS